MLAISPSAGTVAAVKTLSSPRVAPIPLRPQATVVDVARSIHAEVADACRGANVWGPSARFPGQRVGRDHVVAEDDTVEIVVR